MLYSNNDEEQTARVEKVLEELHRGPAAETATFVLLTGWPGTAPPVPAKPKLTLVTKPK